MIDSNKKAASQIMVIVAFAVVYIVWGSTYFFIQRAEEGFPAMMLGAIRFIVAGVIMLMWSWLKGEKLFILKDIKNAAISGVLMLGIGTGVVIWVEQYLPSSIVAIILSSSPVWFVVLDKPKWRENFSNSTTIAGIIIGFAGVVLLFSEKITKSFTAGNNQSDLGSFALIIVGAVAWSAGSLYSKYKGATSAATVNVGWQMLAAGLAFLPGTILHGELHSFQWQNISSAAWLSLFYLIFFGSLAGFSAYVWLLQVKSATQVSTHAYVNPLVAVLLGVFFANESVSLLQIIGLVIILASVLLISISKYRKNKRIMEAEGLEIA
ncbi:MAG: EamA family transporter [Ginsengibacter sp.]